MEYHYAPIPRKLQCRETLILTPSHATLAKNPILKVYFLTAAGEPGYTKASSNYLLTKSNMRYSEKLSAH